MSDFQISVFKDLMSQRFEMSQSLLDLSNQQDQCIETDDYTALVKIMGRKQQLLGQMDLINKKYPTLKKDWLANRELVGAGDRESCDELLAKIEGVLESLMQHEAEATERLEKRRDETQRKLNDVSSGTQVNEEYRDNLAPATHRHLDVGL